MTDFNEQQCRKAVARLAEREGEVLRLMVAGLASKEIADRLTISVNTVRVHRERIYSKLHVNGLAQAVRVATTAKLV